MNQSCEQFDQFVPLKLDLLANKAQPSSWTDGLILDEPGY